MKKIWILAIILLAIILPITYYLVSPLFIVVEVQDESPLDKIDEKVAVVAEPEKEPVEKELENEAAVTEPEKEMTNDKVMVKDDDMPTSPQIIAKGTFQPKAHEVKGKALLIQDGDSKILRFEDFETDNGPDLRIYLASSLDNKDSIDLKELKATKGNVNYEVPNDIDIKKYNKVLVWCRAFKVLFSYAELN